MPSESQQTAHRTGEVISNCISDETLVSSKYKGYLQFNNTKTTQLKSGQRSGLDLSPEKIYK
jgi:hypothetical protein